MTGVFVGGSRRVTRVPPDAARVLESIVAESVPILVGDADGADKALQDFLAARRYEHVTLYCSGDTCRNNVGGWPVRKVLTARRRKDFAFYAAKDRTMAEERARGLMLWDGESVGALMNLERLVALEKPVELFVTPRRQRFLVRSRDDLESVLAALPDATRNDFRRKWTSEVAELADDRRPTRLFPA